MQIELNSSQRSNSAVNMTKVEPQNKVAENKGNAKSDKVTITPETAELTKALESVRSEIRFSRQKGYFDPPTSLSNGKQMELIRERIEKNLPADFDVQHLDEVTAALWKEIGYRDDSAPPPSPFLSSGNMTDFLTEDDRKVIDKAYDAAVEKGLDPSETISAEFSPLFIQRYQESAKRHGVIYDESEITPMTVDEWKEMIEADKASEVNRITENSDPRSEIAKMKDLQNSSLVRTMLDVTTDESGKPIVNDSTLKDIFRRFSEQLSSQKRAF